jgi:diguanylate cyclase (GGDEF)-like protein/PAS domain S-box-containing protein
MCEFEAPGRPPVSALFLIDPEGTIAAWNAGCTDVFGLAPDAVLGQPATLLFATGQAAWNDVLRAAGAEAHPGLRAQPRTGLRFELGAELHGAQGNNFPASLALAPQFGVDGALRGHAVAVTALRAASRLEDLKDLEEDDSESARVARTPLASVVDLFPGTFYAINRDGRFVLWNHNMERLTELTPDELAATRAVDLLDLAQRPLLARAIGRVFELGEEMQLEVEYVSKSGKEIPFLLHGTRIRCNGDDYLFGLGVDIAGRRAHEEHLRLRERALHAASNGIVITRSATGAPGNNLIEYVNPAFERITGYPAREVIGLDPRFMAAPGMDVNERALLREGIAARTSVNVVLRNLRKNGELFWNDLNITPVQDEHGAVTHFIGVINDVTALKQRTAHLEHEVNHDSLTGLANRNLMWDRLEQALHLAQRQKSLVATVLIDLNNFKSINDTHGHEAGDVVLKVVARRLQASVRDSDTVARMSGDEFVLVLVNQPSMRFTLRMVERLRQSFAIPVNFGGREIPIGASVGVSLYPHDGNTAPELVRAADVAMYHGKGNGHNDVHFFSNTMKASTEAKHKLERGLHDAIEHDELFLLYQPRVAVHSGRLTGFEALLRWRHPEHGVLPPSHFLAEAEESGVIIEIGQRVLDQACAFATQLDRLGFGTVPVTVNVSYREYSQPGFVAGLVERLDHYGLAPGSLQLDLRIDSLIRNPALGRELADQLRELGVSLSVDGFGTGLCDLGYLQQLSASQVKLARSTAQAAGDGASGIAKSLVDIGHNLKMQVVGEAVETRPQMEFLTALGCDQLQGIWFSEPLAADAATSYLESYYAARG